MILMAVKKRERENIYLFIKKNIEDITYDSIE